MDSAVAAEPAEPGPRQPPPDISASARAAPIWRLCWILTRARFLHWKNGLLRAPRRAAPRTLALAGLVLPLVYLGLFADAFARIARVAAPQTERAVLAVVVTVLCLSSLCGRIVTGQAVRAGSSENEFFLAHPISLARLMLARALGAAVLDPWGALFLLPIVLAASAVWQAGPAIVPVALALSLCVQVTLAALAQATQVVLVHAVPAVHRRLLWTMLGLLSAVSLAALWIMTALVVRRTETFLEAFTPWVPRFDSGPLSFASRLAFAVARGDGVAALPPLAGALGLAALALLACALAGRWAGHRGWEDAPAAGTEGGLVPRPRTGTGPALSIARRELLALARDRPRLVMLLSLPALFVGVQWVMFDAGLSGSIARNTVVAYSLAVYLAAFGPLPHMQAERGTFWLLRSVPQSLSRLFFGKALAWTLIAAFFSGVVFAILCWAMPPKLDMTAAPMSWIVEVLSGLLRLWFGTTCVVLLAIGLGCEGAELTRPGRSALGPGTVYLFLLIAGLFNLALYDTGGFLTAGGLFFLSAALYWQSGLARAERSLDPEAMAEPAPSAGEGALAALLWALGAQAVRLGARDPQLPSTALWIWVTALGSLVALQLALAARRRVVAALRARRLPKARSLVRTALGVGAVLALTALLPGSVRKSWLLAVSADAVSPWAIVSVCAAREIVFRALLQRALTSVPLMPGLRLGGASRTVAALLVPTLCGALAEPELGSLGVVGAHLVPGVLFSLTGSCLPALALAMALPLSM